MEQRIGPPQLSFLQAKFSNFGFDAFVTVVLFVVLTSAAMAVQVQNDTWWQLRTGQYILETGRLPVTDPFSWTMRGGYWPNHEWLAEVSFYLTYQLGGMRLVAVLSGLAIISTWVLVYNLTAGSGKVRAYALLAAIAVQAMVWSIRPSLFSLLFTASTLALLPHRRLHWLYPLLFLLWANTHAGVAFGGVILGMATIASLCLEQAPFRHWMLISGLSAGATLINPLGFGLPQLVLDSMSNPVLAVTEEWLTPRIGSARSYPFFALLVATVIAVWRQRSSWRSHFEWTLVGSALIFALLGMKSIRHAATFALIAPILLSRHFAHIKSMPPFPVRKRTVHLLVVVVLVVAGAGFVLARWMVLTNRPALEPAIVAALRNCPGRLFNTYEIGGNIIWAVPDRPVFVDNRQDPYPPELILKAKYAETTGDYQSLFAQYEIQCAIMPAHGLLPMALARGGWLVLGQDKGYSVMQAVSR